VKTRLRPVRRADEGATLTEFALIFGLLLIIALGAFEYGMAFRNWLSVTAAAREGGRVAASAANFGDADCVILEATAGGLQSFRSGEVTHVHIYKSNLSGAYAVDGDVNIYRPRIVGEDVSGLLLVCGGTGTWVHENPPEQWPPADRINTEGEADWIGVRVEFDHHWQTNLLWWSGSVGWTDDAFFRLEPPAPNTTLP